MVSTGETGPDKGARQRRQRLADELAAEGLAARDPIVRDHRAEPVVRDQRTSGPIVPDNWTPGPIVRDHQTPGAMRDHGGQNGAPEGGVTVTSSMPARLDAVHPHHPERTLHWFTLSAGLRPKSIRSWS